MNKLFTLLMAITAFATQAGDTYPILKTTDGRSFTNVEVISTNAAYLAISYDGGAIRVPLAKLPESLQRKYSYDPDKARAETASLEQKKTAMRHLEEEQARALLATPLPSPAPPPISVYWSTEFKFDGTTPEHYIHGYVTNNTSSNMTYVSLTFSWSNMEGNLVGNEFPNCGHLEAGKVWEFETVGDSTLRFHDAKLAKQEFYFK